MKTFGIEETEDGKWLVTDQAREAILYEGDSLAEAARWLADRDAAPAPAPVAPRGTHRIRGWRVLCGSVEIGEVFANAEIRGEVLTDPDGSTYLRPHWGAIYTEGGRFAHIGYRSTKLLAAQAVIDSCDRHDA